MKIMIIGCGRQGAELAKTLSLNGCEVTVVDNDHTAFERRGSSFRGRVILGYVSSKVRGRGYSYYQSGAVQILYGNEEELQASVIGTDAYEVDVYREDNTVYVSCTCPYFEGERETCKHIWATLLAAEKQGYLKSKGKSDPVHLEIYVEDKDWDEIGGDDWNEDEEWEDEGIIRPGYGPRSYSPPLQGQRHLRLVSPSQGWKDRLASLRGALQVQQEEEKNRWPATRTYPLFC